MNKFLLFFIFWAFTQMNAQDYWTEYATASPISGTGVRSISIVDDNVVWLNLQSEIIPSTLRRYARSVDSGLTWENANVDLGADSSNLEIANICGVSATTAYAAVFPKTASVRGGVWKTTDGGTNWSKQLTADFSNATSFPTLIHFWNENEGVVVGDPADGYFEIYTTVNGGSNWTRVPFSPDLVPFLDDEFPIINRFVVHNNTIWAVTSVHRILKSSDKGLTWTVLNTPIPVFGGALMWDDTIEIAFTTENKGILIGKDYSVYETNDGGLSWQQITYSGAVRNKGLSAIPGQLDTYIVVGETEVDTERGSSYTIDGGLTWIDINNNPDTNYVTGDEIAMRSTMVGFAGGFSVSPTVGGIFKWEFSLSTTNFNDENTINVFPNPTVDIVSIFGNNIQNITVFDLLGKVYLDNNYFSTETVVVDLNNLNSGIYVARVFDGHKYTSVKLHKL